MEASSVVLGFVLLLVHAKSLVAWNYEEQSEWGGVCASGMKQSPIDIQTMETLETHFVPLHWKKNATVFGSVVLKNSGHGFSVSGPSMENLILTGGGLEGEYQLAQFHYHWGSASNQYKGSEHRIDGKQFASELHLVHFKTDYGNLKDALASGKKDALAVVGVMLTRVTRFAGPDLHEQRLLNGLEDGGKNNKATVDIDFGSTTLLHLLPGDVKSFFRYQGGLTTPTCNEQVVWTVLKEEVTMEQSLLNKFTEVEDADGNTLEYTARHAMPLNDRTVEYNNKNGASTVQLIFRNIFALAVLSIAFLF